MNNVGLTWINNLRLFATFGVIVLHVAGPLLHHYSTLPSSYWWIGNLFDSAMRFSVPVFLMLSGSLILSKNYNCIGTYFHNRAIRVLLPFLFWSFVYIFKDVYVQFLKGDYLTFTETFYFTLNQLKNGASFHLWYVYMIIGLYLFFPILQKWVTHCSNNEIRIFILVWFISTISQLPFMKKLLPDFNLIYFSGYIGLPVVGYYLHHRVNFPAKQQRILSIVLILVGLSITAIGTYTTTSQTGKFFDGYYSYLTPNVIMVAIGVFLLFKQLAFSTAKPARFVNQLSQYSYGIFLVHVLVLCLITNCGLVQFFNHPILNIPVTSVLCFALSALIIAGVNKLPFGKYISG